MQLVNQNSDLVSKINKASELETELKEKINELEG